VKRLGVVGTMVWDTIRGRTPGQPTVEEWGGIAYALAALDAALPEGWEVVPLVKVGRDMAAKANGFLRSLQRTTPHARFLEVPEHNNRVVLSYIDNQRRCEQLTGGVPGWTWPELGPLVGDLDALYINFISGWELDLPTARLLRQGFPRMIYADLHSLFLGVAPDGLRVRRPLTDPQGWFSCFDQVQLNEEEMGLLGDDPMAVAAMAMAQGVKLLCVTLGARGAVYFEGTPVRTGRVATEAPTDVGDPTGCGDVFGAALASFLLRGLPAPNAIAEANRLAAKKVRYRGASGLQLFLQGQLVRA
jgi:pfkB family carbohydrate kinase